MHHLSFTIFLALFLPFTLVLSAPSEVSLSVLGPTSENTVPATFIGSYGDHDFNLNGTVQEVMAQLKEMHPGVELENREVMGLVARNKIMPPLCVPVAGQDWTAAFMSHIDAGIFYLNNLHTRLGVSAKSCARISCSYDSAIYLCNDNGGYIEPASSYIASYAQDLVNLCATGSFTKFPAYRKTGGQEFDSDRYNVIVKQDSC